MKKEALVESLSRINLEKEDKEKILSSVLERKNKNRHRNKIQLVKRLTAVAAILMIVFSVFWAMNPMLQQKMLDNSGGMPCPPNRQQGEDMIELARVREFAYLNRHYMPLVVDGDRVPSLPEDMDDSLLGKKLGVVERQSGLEEYVGGEIFEYIPAKSQFIIAVKKGEKISLFQFVSFEEYKSNKDVNAKEYLSLYGIESVSDIAKIEVINYSEEAKLNNRLDITAVFSEEQVAEFYRYFSLLVDNSDEYFKALGIGSGTVGTSPPSGSQVPPDVKVPPDQSPSDVIQSGDKDAPALAADTPKIISDPSVGSGSAGSSGESTPGMPGTNALSNSITIRVYNKAGIYYEVTYYPAIDFISRYQVPENLSNLLKLFIK